MLQAKAKQYGMNSLVVLYLAVLALLADSFCLSNCRMTLESLSWRVSRSSRSWNYDHYEYSN